MKQTNKLDSDPFLGHEALDRTWMLAGMVESYLGEHPYIQTSPHLASATALVVELMYDIYNRIGEETL